MSYLSVPAVTSCSCFGRILQLLLQVVYLLLKDVALVFPVRGLLLRNRRTETRQASAVRMMPHSRGSTYVHELAVVLQLFLQGLDLLAQVVSLGAAPLLQLL